MNLSRHKSASAWLVAASLIVVASVSRAAELQSSANAERPLAYRQIFVPADKTDAWPREGEKFIPIEAGEFDALVAAANETSDPSGTAATIDAAEYAATLDDDGRLRGTGQWKISVRGDKPAFLPLDKSSLAPTALRWRNAPQEPIRFGTWGKPNQAAEQYGLQVQHAGTLEFEWNILAPAGRNPLEIPWRVPAAVNQRLTLDLPDTMEPTIDGAAVLESKALPAGRCRWLLATTAALDATLQIATRNNKSEQVTVPAADQLTLREATVYRIEQRGVEITFAWDLEVAARKRREVSVQLPRGVQITSLAVNGSELSWRIARGAEQDADRAIFVLPTPDRGARSQIVVTAWHPLVLDRPWQLPVLRPDGAFWSSGKTELFVAPELELENLVPFESTQIGATNIGGNQAAPESYSLIAYSPTANVEVALGRREPVATLRIGSSLVLADQDVTGRMVSEWDVARSGLHRLSGELATGWNVETVETIPAGALAEWFIDRRGNRRQLEIQLTDAAGPERKVTVIIMARLQRFSLAEPIPADALRMVQWSASRVARHLLSFQSSETFAAEPVGDLPLAARDSISEVDRSLLDASADAHHIVDLTRAGPGAGLQLKFQRGTYTADIELEATYAGGELEQRYRITVQPQSNAVDRLLVYSTARLPANMRWVERSSATPLSAERLPADDAQRKDLPPDGELWLLRLPHPTTEAIDVLASATTPWSKREDLALVALPGATEQFGRVIIGSAASAVPQIELTGLVPTPRPIDLSAPGQTNVPAPIRSAFRYNPAECLRAPRVPRMSVGPGSKSGSSSLIARDLKLDTYYWPEGRTTNRAIFQLESHGASEFTPSLPPDAKLTSYSVSGQTLNVQSAAGGVVPPIIRLPPRTDSTTVTLCFDNQQSTLAAGRPIAPPLIRIGIPVISGEWTVWVPEEFAVRTEDGVGASSYDWRRRLFGPLSRANDAPPFHPFRLDDWAELVNGVAGWFSDRPSVAAPLSSSERTTAEGTTLTMAVGAQLTTADVGAKNPTISTAPEVRGIPAPDGSLPGWRSLRQRFTADGSPAPVVVLHPPAITGWAVALMLAAFLVGRQLCGRHRAPLLALLGLAACLTLALPAAIAPLATGLLWGLILACVAEWPRRLLSFDRGEPVRVRAPIAGALVFVAACGMTLRGIADPIAAQLPTQPVATTNTIERVLIPVDNARHPTGSKYYVSERFLRELLSAQAEQPADANQWLLAGATYIGELRSNRDQANVVAGSFTLTYSIETFGRDTTIVLPLVRDEAEWQPTAMLDGVPLPLGWRKTGGCAIEIAQPGRYALTIYCVPKTTVEDDLGKCSLTIPRIGSAAIELHSTGALSGIVIPGADFTTSTNNSPGILSGRIGAAKQLTVEWPRFAARNGTPQGMNVTALSWLHVGSDRTELESRYIFDGDTRRPEALTITFDERWKLMTELKSAGEDKHANSPSGQRSLTVPLSPAAAERQEVSLRWQLTGVPAVGAFRLPAVELSSFSASQRWLAISTDGSLDCVVDDKSATSATAGEFLAKWGGSPESTPQVVVTNFDPARRPTLTVRPRASDSAVREVLHVALGAKAMRVAYRASVSPGTTNQFQFRLNAPPELVMDEIAVTDGSDKLPVRWVRDANNRINIFFSKKASTDYRISLDGTLPVIQGEPCRLPRVAAVTSASTTQQLQLYRDDDVHAELQDLPPADEAGTGPSDLAPVQWLVRPLGVFHIDETMAASARVTIRPNEPQVAADSVTSLSREASGWWATFRSRLVVESSDLDILRLRVGPGWTGPFEFESSVPITSELTPLDESRQMLSIRLVTPVAKGGRFDLKIRGPVATSASAPPALPDIAFATPAKGRRYAVVPKSLDSEPVVWTESGVEPADLPKQLLPASLDSARERQLEITNDQFRIALNPRVATQAAPRIRLADTSISVGGRGGKLIVTRLVLASDGISECTLQLPAEDELVSIKLDGQPALYTLLDGQRYRIVLGAANLPQLLEIISRSAVRPVDSSARELRRPTLLAGSRPIPAEVSLWTVVEPPQIATTRVEDAAPVSRLDQAALRLDRLAGIVEGAAASVTDSPAPDGENWLLAWTAIVRDMLMQTAQLRTQPTSGMAAAQVSRTSEEQLDLATKRLDVWLQQMETQLEGPAATTGSTARSIAESIWAVSTAADATVTCYVAEGGAERLAVQSAGTGSVWLPIRILPFVFIAGLLAVVTLTVRSPTASDFLCRWPHAIGVLLGVAWWAWLWPSWLGLVIAAASVWLSLRFDWPGRSFRAEASTVLRSTRTQ